MAEFQLHFFESIQRKKFALLIKNTNTLEFKIKRMAISGGYLKLLPRGNVKLFHLRARKKPRTHDIKQEQEI